MEKLKEKMLKAIEYTIEPDTPDEQFCCEILSQSCTEITTSVAIGYRNWWMELGAAGRLKLIANLPQKDSHKETFEYYINHVHNFNQNK